MNQVLEQYPFSHFLLAAAALPFLEKADMEQQREALGQALKAKAWKKPVSVTSAQKRQAEKLLLDLRVNHPDCHKSIIEAYPLFEGAGKYDQALARLFIYLFFALDTKDSQLEDFLAAAEILADNPEKLKAWLSLLVLAESFRAACAILDSLDPADSSESALDRVVAAILKQRKQATESLPWQYGRQLAKMVADDREELDSAIDKFLKLSRISTLSPTERNFLDLALYEYAAENVNGDIMKAALARALPEEANVKIRKFLRNALIKAASSRTRELAFQTLYALSFDPLPKSDKRVDKQLLSNGLIPVFESLGQAGSQRPLDSLIDGVARQQTALDDIIGKFSHKWRVSRIGRMELVLLRMGIYEINSGTTPPRVVMNEILDLAERFGVPEARSLVNGILDAVAKADGKQV